MGTIFERRGKFWVQFRHRGKRVKEKAGTREQAKALLAKRETELFENRYFPEKRQTGLSIEGLSDLWEAAKKSKLSFAADRSRFETLVYYLGASAPVASLNPARLRRLKTELGAHVTRNGRPMSPTSVNHHLSLLRAALRLAAAEGHLVRNPFDGVAFLPPLDPRDRICSPDEYARLCDGAAAVGAHDLRLVVMLAFGTAMRRAEYVGLRREWLDLDARLVRLPSAITKTKRGRRVPLAPELVAELRAWPDQPDGRLFDRSPRAFTKAFAVLCRRLGIEDLRLHDQRHTAATNLRRGGADVFTLQAITGHARIESLRRYQTVTEDDLLEAVDRAGAAAKRRAKRGPPKRPKR